MSVEFKNIIKIASIYMATIIGAGFASGQEIIQFFSVYYEGGFYGIAFAGVLFSVVGYIVLDRVYTDRIRDYDEFLFPTLGWTAGWIVETAATIFMLCLFCIMIAGSANILAEKLGIPLRYSILAMSIICMFIILSNIKGIVVLSSVVTPILVAGILLIGIYLIISKDRSVFNAVDYFRNITGNWLFSSLIYVSYNSIMSVIVMCSLLPYLKTRRTGRIGGVLGGAMLCFVALVMNTALFFFYPRLTASELPVLNIVGRFSNIAGGFYAVILWLAMLVSAVNSGFCFVDRISSKVKVDRRLLILVLCAAAVPLSSFGFSKLIASIYPVFGYIGLFLIFCILIHYIKTMFLKNKFYDKIK